MQELKKVEIEKQIPVWGAYENGRFFLYNCCVTGSEMADPITLYPFILTLWIYFFVSHARSLLFLSLTKKLASSYFEIYLAPFFLTRDTFVAY